MKVKDAMSATVLTVGPDHTVLEAAQIMVRRHVGAAVVVDDGLPGPGIVTERDVLRCIADGRDPTTTRVADCMTFDARTATDTWDLDKAAEEMVRNNFRHLLVVVGQGALIGVVSIRDIVRAQLHGGVART